MIRIYGEFIKSIKSFFRNKTLALLTLSPPIILTFFFVQLFTVSGSSGFGLVVVNNDDFSGDPYWTNKFIDSLESQEGPIPYFSVTVTSQEQADALFNQRKTFVIITIPDGFEDNLTAGSEVSLQVKYNNIHEDLSKNILLGIESRIYYFNDLYRNEIGDRPGITYRFNLVHSVELVRAKYMMSGIYVFITLYFTLSLGGTLGSDEKEKKNIIEIEMSSNGILYSKLGKILATITISAILMGIMILLNTLFYGTYFPSFLSFMTFLGVFLMLATIFSTIGVFYGMQVGDFRFIPAPTIIISMTLWVLAGAINPLEFSAGSEIFKYLPTAASIRLLTAAVFNRGTEYVFESWIILGLWTAVFITLLILYFAVKNLKGKLKR